VPPLWLRQCGEEQSLKQEQRRHGFNPFMPSVPQNGTPSLTANYKIIQALMG